MVCVLMQTSLVNARTDERTIVARKLDKRELFKEELVEVKTHLIIEFAAIVMCYSQKG